MVHRTPYSGTPFYCTNCGMGYDEYMACEEPDCKLEGEDAAIERKLKRDFENIFGKPEPVKSSNKGKRKINFD